MAVPQVDIVPLQALDRYLGGPETPAVGVYLETDGAGHCSVLFLFSEESSLSLVNLLLAEMAGRRESLDEMAASALLEIGNILTCAFLGALAKITGIELKPSVPALGIDMAGALFTSVLAGVSATSNYAIVMATRLTVNQDDVMGYFFLIPDAATLGQILKAIGVSDGVRSA